MFLNILHKVKITIHLPSYLYIDVKCLSVCLSMYLPPSSLPQRPKNWAKGPKTWLKAYKLGQRPSCGSLIPTKTEIMLAKD